MDSHHYDPLAHAEVTQVSAVRYIVGFLTSVVLMLAALLLTLHPQLPYEEFTEVTGGLAVLALMSQVALFFGLDLTIAQIWKSVSLVLTVPLFILVVGLTVWMFQSLNERTMLMPTGANMAQPTLLQ